MLLNCVVDEGSWESLGLQGDPTSHSSRTSVLNIYSKDSCWSWHSNTLATWWEELIHLKRPWCWEILKSVGEEDVRGWDGWMSSLTQWAWVWVSPGSCWWIGRPGVPHSLGLQRVRHAWATKLNWTEPNPLQYSYLENPMDRGAWQPTVHKSQNVRHDWTSDYAHTVFGISGSASACSTWQVQRLLFMLCYISVFCFKILQYL